MNNKKIILKREELYERVWQTPMIKLATEYNISGNGLKKICGKLKVPVPPVGYWQKLAYGYNVKKPPLPEIDENELEQYELSTIKKLDVPLDEKYKILIQAESNPSNKIQVKKHLSRYHPLITSTRNTLKGEKPDSDGLLRRIRTEILAIAVSPKNFNRALRIFNTLLFELEKRNFQIRIEMNYLERNETFIIRDNQKIQIELRETLKMNKSKIDKTKYPWKSYEYERVFLPTGELRLEIKNVYGGSLKKVLVDQSNKPLEEQLNDFIINIYKSINYHNFKDKELEKERRIEEQKEKARKLLLKQKQMEKEKTKLLYKNAKLWKRVNIIREYLKELESRSALEKELSEEKLEWINWAKKKADSLDPINKFFEH